MGFQRFSVSLFGFIAIVSGVLAAATVWLLLTDPVTVATAVNEGEVSPLVRELARVLLDALSGLLKTFDGPAKAGHYVHDVRRSGQGRVSRL